MFKSKNNGIGFTFLLALFNKLRVIEKKERDVIKPGSS